MQALASTLSHRHWVVVLIHHYEMMGLGVSLQKERELLNRDFAQVATPSPRPLPATRPKACRSDSAPAPPRLVVQDLGSLSSCLPLVCECLPRG